MKKMKWVVSLLVAFLLMGIVAPAASAQVNLEEFFTKAYEANKNVTSGHVAGITTLSIAQGTQSTEIGQLKFDFKGNLKDDLSAQATIDVLSVFLGSQAVNGEVYFKDNTLTVITPDSTSVEQVDEAQIDQFKTQFESYQQQAAQVSIADQVANAEKYFDVTETDSAYVVSFKKDIDMTAFWESVMTPEIIAQIKEQAIKQAEASGQSLDATTLEMVDKMYSAEFLSKLISEAPALETHYAKDTYLVTKYIGTVTFNIKAVAELMDADASALESLPEKATLTVELTVDGQNQPQEIVVPEVKIESSMEESSSSAE